MKPYQWLYVLAGAMLLFLVWFVPTQARTNQGTAIAMLLVVSPIIFWTLSNAQKSRDRDEAQQAASPEDEPERASLAEELERLAALRAAGELTEDEYRAAKAKLLD